MEKKKRTNRAGLNSKFRSGKRVRRGGDEARGDFGGEGEPAW